MSDTKCPFCGEEMKLTSLYMDGNHRYSHRYIGGFNGNKDRCPFNGETLPLRALQEIHRTHKELEQSEICCSEWAKQALDYKAENIALSSDLECTRKALGVAVDALKRIKNHSTAIDTARCRAEIALDQIKQITEQKD